jgi:glycosyltransferase involved in cell wall biosynthesis
MKIAIIQDFLRSGGTERQSVLLANAFATAGHATTLITFRPGGALVNTVSETVIRQVLQPFDLGLDWFAPGLPAAINRSTADVVLCMGRMANCYAGGLQKRNPSVAVVGTMRTGKKLPRLFRRSLQIVRHVVANSHDARDTLLRDLALPADKISVIHNSLVFPAASTVASDASSVREKLRQHYGATTNTAIFLCVAMFRPEKNQRELIEIVADLPRDSDWQLWLAGDGPARPACEQLTSVKGLGGRVQFVGFHRDPSPLYRAADVAVHASSSEALSNFLIEAQAHGLPAVAYEAQGIQECFVPQKTGWAIARDNRVDFRAALLRLMDAPPATRADRSNTARTFARETFDPQRQVAAYLELFSRLRRPVRSA